MSMSDDPQWQRDAIIDREGLDAMIRVLREWGFTVVGPTVEQDAIVYDELTSTADLPENVTDEQGPGHYRLKQRNDGALFGYNVGPHAWKKFLFPPEQRLWSARRTATGIERIDKPEEPPTYAFLGVRACEQKAIEIQDRVFVGSAYQDPAYADRRESAFVVAVNCGEAGGTCFCVSMQSGPKAQSGYDLALTELIRSDEHVFLVEVGSRRGAEVLAAVPYRSASTEERGAAEQAVAHAESQMGRTMETHDIQGLLQRNFEHPRWDEVAERCLACANCTLVCPTCFCSDIEDVSDLSGDIAERWRRWGSCFTQEFSYVHGHTVRESTRARYRQWMTHKLSTWFDQFGTSGCVGCGRCITWCPVGIDITEEVAAIRADDPGQDA